ncbi:hypothetical protein BGX31_007028, partial [Mortierella sp. GBA43]
AMFTARDRTATGYESDTAGHGHGHGYGRSSYFRAELPKPALSPQHRSWWANVQWYRNLVDTGAI